MKAHQSCYNTTTFKNVYIPPLVCFSSVNLDMLKNIVTDCTAPISFDTYHLDSLCGYRNGPLTQHFNGQLTLRKVLQHIHLVLQICGLKLSET